MRSRLAVTAILIVVLTGQLAFWEMRSVKPAGPTGGARPLTAPTKAVPPPGDALRNLAGGGYADPNYAPPGTHAEEATRHRVVRTPRSRWAGGSLFTGYRSYKAFPYRDCS